MVVDDNNVQQHHNPDVVDFYVVHLVISCRGQILSIVGWWDHGNHNVVVRKDDEENLVDKSAASEGGEIGHGLQVDELVVLVHDA